MRFVAPLIPGVFLRREKRFLAEVALDGDRRTWAHVPNTGALTGCLTPGQEVLLTEESRPHRKTTHTWRFCKVEAGWVCVDTLVPNRLVAEALAGRVCPDLPPLLSHRGEVTLPGGSRLDFVADLGERLLFMEVKSVTWVEDGRSPVPRRRHRPGPPPPGSTGRAGAPGVMRPGRSLWCSGPTPSGSVPPLPSTRPTPGNWPGPRRPA